VVFDFEVVEPIDGEVRSVRNYFDDGVALASTVRQG
jgi:hypothetical protein